MSFYRNLKSMNYFWGSNFLNEKYNDHIIQNISIIKLIYVRNIEKKKFGKKVTSFDVRRKTYI